MAYKLVNEEWCATLGDYKSEFIADTEADIANLPVCCVGSTALVTKPATAYIVNASGVWVAL